MTEKYEIKSLDANAALQNKDFVATWKTLFQEHSQPSAVFSSPEWISHLQSRTTSHLRVWSVRNRDGNVVGVIPVQLGKFVLRYSVFNRALSKKRLLAAHIIGSAPPLPEYSDIFPRVIQEIFSEWPQCRAIYADAVSMDNYLWQSLREKQRSLKRHFVYVVDGPRPRHLLKLESSFNAYLNTMSTKARANLRREVRKLDSMAEGRLNLFRCTVEDTVEEFLHGAIEVSHHSWQQKVLGTRIDNDELTQSSFKDLSRRGILRSYLLRIGDQCCAFVIGYQLHGVYHYREIGFDERYSEYSPGKVLLFLIIEDLHNHNRPLLLDFGVGDASYKRRFGNYEEIDASCLFLRKNIANWLLISTHWLFKSTVTAIKDLLGRRVTK